MRHFITTSLLAAALALPIATRAADTCYVVMDGSATTNYFGYVGDAINSIGTGTGVVTMIADDSIMTSNLETRINVVGNVTLVSDGGDHTIWRGIQQAPTNYTLLYVARFGESNAVLNLGAPSMPGTLTFDGGSFTNTSASLVLNYQNGTLNLYDGVILKNNISGFEGSGVYNEGTFNMYGGIIVSNVSFGLGGGVDNAGYWSGSKAIFNMYGGTIAHNESRISMNHGGLGGGVANEGSAIFNLFGGSIENNQAELAGGGIFNAKYSNAYAHTNGSLHITGGSISGNAVTATNGMGNGVYSDKILTMGDAASLNANNDVFISNGVILVTSQLTESGVIATLSSASTTSGTQLVKVDIGSGQTLDDVLPSFALVSGSGQILAVDIAADAIIRATAFEAWLLSRGYSYTDPDYAPASDSDDDNATTWEEYLADTDPGDASSVLAITIGSLYSTNYVDIVATNELNEVVTNRVYDNIGIVFSWPSASGRIYDVENTDSMLPATWQATETDIPATPPANIYTNLFGDLPPDALRFYRTRVRLGN
ncbi:MAG: hypothetical protein M9963_04990 [Kiritimatiellae bacterium]|nr:hypothetical protein [Kiritimatiellia bacterium]